MKRPCPSPSSVGPPLGGLPAGSKRLQNLAQGLTANPRRPGRLHRCHALAMPSLAHEVTQLETALKALLTAGRVVTRTGPDGRTRYANTGWALTNESQPAPPTRTEP